MTSNPDFKQLEEIARKLRCNIVQMIADAGSGHPGGSLSATDIITYLYFHQLRVDPQKSHWEDRDRFILSKGHSCPALYAALAERGFFPETELSSLRDIESMLQGHPDMKRTPGIDMTTGSLGQGLSCGVGMALGARLQEKDFRVYVMVGDGEIESGQIWEAAMAAANYRLDNLVVFLDKNGLQLDGPTATIMNSEPLAEKWRAFGWQVTEIDGHSFREIHKAVQGSLECNGCPKIIISKTVKGKGVSFMEGRHTWHGGAPNETELETAINDIRGEKG